MIVRPFRRRLCGRCIRSLAVAALIAVVCAPWVAAQQRSTPATHTVKRGDTLWDIAKTYLGDPFLWPEIYRLNSGAIEDPHWIYPGEIIKLPGSSTAVAPPEPASRVAARVAPPAPTMPSPPAATPIPPAAGAETMTVGPAAMSQVRAGEYVAAPWVDQRGGPRSYGYIVQRVNLPGIASADQSRLGLFDDVFISPPRNNDAAGARLLAYRLGPLIEGFGQIVIPTGVLEVTRPSRDGEAAVARVMKMFGEMLQTQLLLSLDDLEPAALPGESKPIGRAMSGRVRWINNQPVLPSIQNYLVVDIPQGQVSPGDVVDLYEPRRPSADPSRLALPEVFIAKGQVLRVTPLGATVIVTAQEQPKIEMGTAARVAAKIP